MAFIALYQLSVILQAVYLCMKSLRLGRYDLLIILYIYHHYILL